MGEVYRARDTKLNRDVALKILPEAFARDPDRLARFEREAQLLASLNHPNIASIYGLEEGGSDVSDHGAAFAAGAASAPKGAGHYVSALVLELVEGPTLADRIATSPLPLDEALAIARQIAQALEAAHRLAIVHRDLKPANIKVRSDGTVKVLDFGLAKALAPPSAALNATRSPTITSPAATLQGVILGTAAYMSPEQARGRDADARSDVWAFGCVLYEMLSGRRAFETGETISDAVAAVLMREPDWAALPADVPAHIRRLLRRCLQKDPDRRLHHIADARIELDEGMSELSDLAPPVARTPGVARWMRAIPWVVAALALGTAAWMAWGRSSFGAEVTRAVARLEVTLPAGVELGPSSTRTIAVSPDGARTAFVGRTAGTRQIYVRTLDQFEAVPLRGTDNATSCFFAPDGRSIGFVTNAGVLKTLSLADGLVATVTGDANFLYGSAWGADDRIVFVRADALWHVPRTGGTPTALTTLGGAQADTLHAWPLALPDGKTILFSAASGDRWRIEALALATGERRTVVEQGMMPLFTDSGHLLFVRAGELLAAPFDAARLQVTGPAVPAIGNQSLAVGTNQGVPIVDVSATGTMVYAPTTVSRLVWVSRQGAEQPLNDVLRSYQNPRLAPDGNRLLVEAGDLWIQDVARPTFTRLTEQTTIGYPVWTPDGRVLYRTQNELRIVNADGGGQGDILAGTSPQDFPLSVSADGETLVLARGSQETDFDIFTLPLRDAAQARSILATKAYEGGARLSPDGRWLTYTSREAGQFEVYLRPFPGPDRRWPVSTQGGTQAIWNPNGKEIFYRDGNKMMVVEVAIMPDITLSPPRVLFERPYAFGSGLTIANYDVTRDGQRFVMVKDESSGGRLHVILNWPEELRRRAPVK
jgi:Tol biopolymer transport system component